MNLKINSRPQSVEDCRLKIGNLYDLGFVQDYSSVWYLQKKLLEQRIAGTIPDSLILVEHGHVITLGRSSHIENVLTKDLPMFEIERGGDVTYHGPGQLVGYPIVSLQERSLGVRQYVEILEKSIIDALMRIGLKNLKGKLGKETGVWIGDSRKIASIGVAVSHWVTYHGLALNVHTDLSYFQKINPCGFDASVMTSIEKETRGAFADLEKTKAFILTSLSSNLGIDFRRTDSPLF